MGDNRKDLDQEEYPQSQLHSATPDPTGAASSTPDSHARNDRPVSAPGSEKTVDLGELKENERRFHTIFEAAPIGIFIADPDGRFLKVNDRFSRMLDYDSDDLNELSVLEVTHPEDRSEAQRLINQVLDGQINSYSFENRYLTKDGNPVWARTRDTAIRHHNGTVKYRIGLIEDIAEHKKIAQTIRESQDKYRNILEVIEEGYFEVNLQGDLTFFNNSMCKITGYRADELNRRNYREYTTSETAKKIWRIFSSIYETGRAARVLNYEVITKDGTKKILYLSASLMRDADQNPIGFRGIVQDVTDQLIAEKQREQLASQMLHAQKMEAVGTLAGGIAHDFNNLLMGFQGNLSLMLLDVDPKHPHHDYLINMENYIKRGSELTRQILGFARGGKYEVKPTDLNELLDKSSEMFSRTKKEILIHKKFQANLWPVEVDRGQIEQVLLNLFVNAWQAMPSGGKLFIETENMIIGEKDLHKHYALTPGKYVRISVTDTGVGMDKTTRERVFEPFFTTKEVGRGTGLGLASAYGIIKNHSGNIEVDSEINQGTTFKVYLPISKKTVIAENTVIGKTYKGRETILLIDDEAMIARTGRRMLEKLGYHVLVAESGQAALEIFEEFRDRIDLIVLDMIMPGMGGSEIFDRLKTLDPSIRVLLSSGYSLNGQASKIMKRGCEGFIQKPFNIEQFSKKIREILDSSV